MVALIENNVHIGGQTNIDFGLVSIIMPNYNSRKYLEATVESVVAQTYGNWELIIVDDCSTDGSLDLLTRFNDERIRIFKNETNSGAACSRNRAIDEAKGEWIAFLDSDDLWERDKLSHHISFMVNNNAVFSCTDYSVIDSADKQVAEFRPDKEEYDYKMLLRHCYIGCSTVIYNCDALGKVYMPTEAEKREDYACWLGILKSGVAAIHYHESLTRYRLRDGSVSSKKLDLVKYQWNVYRNVERLSLFESAAYMCYWAVLGFLKYR